jgi:nucleoside-diphosphate-sugar epimerase
MVERPDRPLLTVVRPTVVFGENNRGNVYNLLKQMAVGPFLMVGKGRNVKSVAYVENVAAFLEHSLSFTPGKHLYNYIDKPDYSMKELVNHIDMMLRGRPRRMIRIPYVIGYLGGAFLDGVARITGRNFPISAVRVKKFCADTMFSTRKDEADGFTPPVSLDEAWKRTVRHEFQENHPDAELYFTE